MNSGDAARDRLARRRRAVRRPLRGHGPGRGLVSLAAFALFAPFIIAGEVTSSYGSQGPRRAGARALSTTCLSSAPVYYSPPSTRRRRPLAGQCAPVSLPPRVILYPHGRYVLQGDGVVTAYRWVWIPNPPLGPPPLPPA